MSTSKLTEAVASYIQNRAEKKLEDFDKSTEKEKKKLLSNNHADLVAFAEQAQQKRTKILESFDPTTWLNDAAKRAKQINVVTHALKFTHTDAKGSSIYANNYQHEALSIGKFLLGTHQVSKLSVDVVGNAAALDVASLLSVSVDGKSLLDYVADGDLSPLAAFATNEDQLDQWLVGFSKALVDDSVSSHTLTKQLYFPVANQTYHLIAPLFSSSLAHELYEKIHEARFSEQSKATRVARKKGLYSVDEVVIYPNLAVQQFGGSNQQNVSKLNSKRNGKAYFLSCQPPKWITSFKPPQNKENQFFNQFRAQVKDILTELKTFLERVSKRGSNFDIRDNRARLVDEIVDHFLIFSSQIRGLTKHAGWSAKSKLPRAQQLWLDPLRSDDEFQKEYVAGNWQSDLAKQFAFWFNQQLESKKLKMDDGSFHEWKKILKEKLKLFEGDLEVMSK